MSKIITQSDYTSALVSKRNDLADNITEKGVEAEQTEKLNTLVPKVLEIPSGVPTETMTELREKLTSLGIPIPDDATDEEMVEMLISYPLSVPATWFVDAAVNDGYPYYTQFAGIIPDVWDSTEPHNPSLWRLEADKNDGYPYTYYMKQWVEA